MVTRCWLNEDALSHVTPTNEVKHSALIDGQLGAGIEHDAVRSGAASVNGEAAKRDGIIGVGIDGNAVAAGDRYAGEVAGIDDADGLSDRDRPVARATEHDNLTAWCSLRERVGKCSTWRADRAGPCVVTDARHKRPGRRCQCGGRRNK